ncbi:uncharacterized protein M421DRAFT_99193 [Didymella exigua CBS 183.55]|uniref:BCS1 N-terminal domain-containing protein n=1 Tax=Didymella exigua CBS 183.55 TaxID=1150837 RepID=A0A6A5RSG6_9PLEO|nr:uncharacterized protein M421DRAFT_99193 [Didymella exigua CBS 183.55]KAF1931335.1 hypothetical protein M421DRAFT_99193 [Didymella exigua CBS 183.55]
MDFSRLQNLQYELNSANTTAANLPSTLLELVVPGYSTISQLAFRILGIDIGVLVTGWALLFGSHTAWRYLYDLVQGYFDNYYTSSIHISDDDGLFDDVKAWLSEQQNSKSSRKLKAVTDYEDKKKDDNVHDEHGIYKYEVPMPRYEPSYGSDDFVHGRRRFKVVRSSVKDEAGSYMRETLEIYCYSRTAQPVKELLVHIRQWKISQETAMTSVYRALNSGGRYWSRQSCRPSRPLHTVSLDQQQKDDVVEDINEYLHPATARWYAARGIPHRRGYLFHGPPRYRQDLSIDLTESDLCSLFDSLPDRCIVLLEDIDSAGLKREEEAGVEIFKSGDSSLEASSREATKAAETKTEISSGSISLSALLNVIDGAASHEGHVLIMTTNTPEQLDAALIRPGRVDLQVAFTLATDDQIRETFMRMYSQTPGEQTSGGRLPSSKSRPVSRITDPKTLEEMAREFAAQLPSDKFSPAEIQGYLLMRKKDPRRALKDVENWRDEMLESKKKGKKLVGAH